MIRISSQNVSGIVKEAVGFEPTVRIDYRITGVQIRHLKPLGHASKMYRIIFMRFALLRTHTVIARVPHDGISNQLYNARTSALKELCTNAVTLLGSDTVALLGNLLQVNAALLRKRLRRLALLLPASLLLLHCLFNKLSLLFHSLILFYVQFINTQSTVNPRAF